MFRRISAYLRPHLETVYLTVFAVYLASVTINTTTFFSYYPHRVATIIQLLTAGLMLAKIVFFDELTTKQIMAEMSLLSLVLIVTLISSAHYLVTTVLLVMAARGINFRRILKTYLGIVGGILLVAFIAAMLGIIQNITFVTEDGVRQSFGVVYTTDFAAHIFYLSCVYLYLKARRFELLDLVPVLFGLWVIYHYTQTMTDTIAMIVLIVTFMGYIYRRQLSKIKVIITSLRYYFLALPVITILIVWLTAVFDFNDKILRTLNDLLSTRLALGNNGLLAYGVKLFGQPWIPMNGWGGDRSTMVNAGIGEVTYFFIDSSFLNMLISYGLLLTLAIIIGLSFFLYLRTKQNDYLLPTIFLAIAIASAFDQHFLEVTYNVFFLAVFAELPHYRTLIGPRFDRPVVYQRKFNEMKALWE
ncbi:polysaccharide biosynthesis protein [Lactiplantibacillus paraxiangfangensis]|uniref:polysaccharide biosynthesis protein n=1 Tax=Lactiplantibacillus paraxiangfangensis TaxID=3076224 RepID=UPI0030C6E9B2